MNDPVLVHVPTTIHGRVLVDLPTTSPTAWILGFHGYGEAADDHLERLRRTRSDQPWLLASVQALHPFYRRQDGSVVASWMTKLDRELAIAENVEYVERAMTVVRDAHGLARVPLAVAGFSQGVAMTWRAAAAFGDAAAAVVTVGGDVPPELRVGDRPLPPALVARGRRDEWYSESKWQVDRAALESRGGTVVAFEHDGGHDWPDEVADAARGFLLERLKR